MWHMVGRMLWQECCHYAHTENYRSERGSREFVQRELINMFQHSQYKMVTSQLKLNYSSKRINLYLNRKGSRLAKHIVRHDMVWHGVAWPCVVWCDVACCGMAWYGMVWHSMVWLWCGMGHSTMTYDIKVSMSLWSSALHCIAISMLAPFVTRIIEYAFRMLQMMVDWEKGTKRFL